MTDTNMEATAPLPRLRADLRLHEGQRDRSGAATWIIEDPVRNKFFQIDDKAFTILSLWDEEDTAAILRAAEMRAGVSISLEEVAELAEFLVGNGLAEMDPFADYGRLAAILKARKPSWMELAVHHYLFFRIPLVRPHKFLQRTLPAFDVIFSRGAWLATGVISMLGLYAASRQWDAFVSTFLYFFNFDGAVFYALCLVFVKTAHELGHAYMATRYGVRVATMGVAFLVLMPVLYTDVTGSWKLRSRKQRFLIAAAGLMTELMIAGLAVFVWAFAPEGPVRSAAFFMAVVSLVSSLFVNLNPFMRFDGYYLVSDVLAIPNLQQRAFALGRWWLRNALFGLKVPNPDHLGPALTRFCVVFAYLTWLYRFVIFIGIALFVYSFFIKVIGILLLVVEITAFIAWPIAKEFVAWWRMRDHILKERRAFFTIGLAIVLLAVFFLPLSHSVRVPTILRAETEARVYAPRPAEITSVLVHEGQAVNKGQVLFRMRSRKLEQDLAVTKLKIEALTVRLARRSADPADRSESLVLAQQRAAERAKLDGLSHEISALVVRSPVTGVVADLPRWLHAARFVDLKRPLAVIRGNEAAVVEGYAGEEDIWRLKVGAQGYFIPEDPSLKRFPVRLTSIAYAASGALDILYLASIHDGDIAAKETPGKKLRPVNAVHKLLMATDARAPAQVMRGSVYLTAKRESLATMLAARVLHVLIRESGF